MSSPQLRASVRPRRHVFALAVVGAFLLVSMPGAQAEMPVMPSSPSPIWSKTFDDQTQGRTGRVAVVGGRVYAEVGPSIDDNVVRSYAYDAQTGRNLFTLTYGVTDLVAHDEAGSYVAMPDEARRETRLTRYDNSGRIAGEWPVPFAATGMSVDKGRVYLVERNNSSNVARYYAYDTLGRQVWATSATVARGFADARVMGSGLFVAHSCGAIDRFSAATGDKRWSRTPTCADNPDPWLPTSYGRRLYTQVKGGTYRILDFTTGATLDTKQWDTMPRIDGSTGYFIRDGVLHTMDMRTARRVWQFGANSGIHRVLTTGENRVAVMAGSNNRVYLLTASTGQRRWTAAYTEPSGMAIGAGRVVVGWGPSLVAYPL